MSLEKIFLGITLLAFSILTAIAVTQHGYWGFFEEALSSSATRLLSADLVICLVLICLWMFQDARRRGRRVWPFLLISGLFGAAGPLLYLVSGGAREAKAERNA